MYVVIWCHVSACPQPNPLNYRPLNALPAPNMFQQVSKSGESPQSESLLKIIATSDIDVVVTSIFLVNYIF